MFGVSLAVGWFKMISDGLLSFSMLAQGYSKSLVLKSFSSSDCSKCAFVPLAKASRIIKLRVNMGSSNQRA